MVRLKNVILLILIVAVLILSALFYSSSMFLFFAGGLIFAVAASVLTAMLSVKNLKIKLNVQRDFVDKDFENIAELEILNKNIIPFVNAEINFEVQNGFYNEKCKFVFSCPLKKGIIKIPVKSRYCGKIIISAKKIKAADLFNVIAFRKKCDEKCFFYVMPEEKQCAINTDEIIKSGVGEETGSETAVNGDVITGAVPAGAESNMKNIHWKMTVKKNKIMLKEFAESCSNEITLLVSVSEIPSKTDEALSLFRSFAYNLISKGKSFYVSYYNNNSEMPFKVLVEDEISFYTVLRVVCNEAEYVGDKAYKAIDSISRETQVVYLGEDYETGKTAYIIR